MRRTRRSTLFPYTTLFRSVVVNAGVLNVQNDTGLGTTAGGVTVSASGAALELQGGINIGADGMRTRVNASYASGAYGIFSRDNRYAGVITLGSDSRINSDA